MLFLSSAIIESKLGTSGQILMQRSLKQLLSTTIRDFSCARSQAGRGRELRADVADAAAAYSTKIENDLHACKTSFISLPTPTLINCSASY
jgi:hypothetical protein